MKRLNDKGITLIALVITIIVLLILAGVSIATLTGENGILTKASEADIETGAATVEERKNLWKTEKQADNYIGENTAQTLEDLLDDLETEDLITAEERTKIEETGHVVIGSKDISFSDGLTEASYTITSSLDEVNFNKIITEGDIAIEKPGYTSYRIEGIMLTKEEEAKIAEPVEGKSGILEVVGDISDATFKYTLKTVMQGDETFYCKVNIDGEDYYKEIDVIQGDVITYEEDFAGFQYTGSWQDDTNENYSNGKAKYVQVIDNSSSNRSSIRIDNFTGSKIDILSRKIQNIGVISVYQYSEDMMVLGLNSIRDENINGDSEFQAISSMDIRNDTRTIELRAKKEATDKDIVYIDAIRIYK